MKKLLLVLALVAAGCGATDPEWCRITYYFPPIPDSLATDSIPWWDPDAPVVKPDSTVAEYDC